MSELSRLIDQLNRKINELENEKEYYQVLYSQGFCQDFSLSAYEQAISDCRRTRDQLVDEYNKGGQNG